MWHAWEAREVHAGFWWGDLRERGRFEDRRILKDNIKMHFQKVGLDWIDLAQDKNR
jgi:hypothetical protein